MLLTHVYTVYNNTHALLKQLYLNKQATYESRKRNKLSVIPLLGENVKGRECVQCMALK